MTAPLVLLHGFVGHAESWNEVIEGLPPAIAKSTVALNLFGHDPNDVPAAPITFEQEVDRVARIIAAIGTPVRLCGYSLGGRVALGLLDRHPQLFASMIVVGVTPGLHTEAERVARIAADGVWIKMLEERGIAPFVEAWQAQGLFDSQKSLPADRLERQAATRLRHSPRGLAHAVRTLGLGLMPSYWSTIARTDMPVELIVGKLDAKFLALAEQMHAVMKTSTLNVVEGVGHNVLLERPELMVERLLAMPSEPPRR